MPAPDTMADLGRRDALAGVDNDNYVDVSAKNLQSNMQADVHKTATLLGARPDGGGTMRARLVMLARQRGHVLPFPEWMDDVSRYRQAKGEMPPDERPLTRQYAEALSRMPEGAGLMAKRGGAWGTPNIYGRLDPLPGEPGAPGNAPAAFSAGPAGPGFKGGRDLTPDDLLGIRARLPEGRAALERAGYSRAQINAFQQGQ